MDDKDNQQPRPQQAPMPPNVNEFSGPIDDEPTTVPPPNFAGTAPSSPLEAPVKKTKKKWLVAGVIAAILVVLAGGSALAYKFWYQNPEKVVTDGLVNAMAAETMKFKLTGDMKSSTPGTIMITGALKSGAFSADADMKMKVSGTDVELKGSGLMDEKGDLYLKISNLNTLVDKALGQNKAQLPAQMSSAIYGFVTKVNDKWVKISSDDLKTFSESMAKQQSCMSGTFKKLREDKAMKTEVSDLYKKHKFITVSKELGSKDGSLGYELSSNDNQAKEFTKGLKDTQFYKSLHDCDKNFTIDENDAKDSTSSNNTKVQVWISRWSHDITKVTAEVKDEAAPGTITFEPTFGEPVTIETPNESMSVKELTQEITNFQKAVMNAYTPTYTPTTTPTTSDSSSLLN